MGAERVDRNDNDEDEGDTATTLRRSEGRVYVVGDVKIGEKYSTVRTVARGTVRTESVGWVGTAARNSVPLRCRGIDRVIDRIYHGI
jgi:hypothetical protein